MYISMIQDNIREDILSQRLLREIYEHNVRRKVEIIQYDIRHFIDYIIANE